MWPFNKSDNKINVKQIPTDELLYILDKGEFENRDILKNEGNKIVHELLYRLNESMQCRIRDDMNRR